MAESDSIQFPAAVDTFDAVESGKVVYAKHINHLADAAIAIEGAAKNTVMTDRSAETNGTSEIRRQIVLDCVTVDQQGLLQPYTDVQVTLKNNDGNTLPSDVWTNKDYAIHMDVVNTKTRPQIPTSVSGPFDSTPHDLPYNWSIVGYNGATATVRVLGHEQTMPAQPQLLATNPSRSKLYALCGSTDTSPMTMIVFDSTGVYQGSFTLQTPSVTKYGLQLQQTYESFAVAESGNIYLLYKPYNKDMKGIVIKYGPSGTIISQSLIDQAELNWATCICVDTSENVYVSHHVGVSCSLQQFTSAGAKTGKYYAWALGSSGGKSKYQIMLGCAFNVTDGYIYMTGSTRHEVSSDRDATVMVLAKWNPVTGATQYWDFWNNRNYANSQSEVDRAGSGTYSMGRCTVLPDGRVIWIDRYVIPIGNGDNTQYYNITNWEKLTSYNQMYIRSAKLSSNVENPLQFDPGMGDWHSSYFDDPAARTGYTEIHNGNIPYSVVAMGNGWVFATCTRLADAVNAYSNYTGIAQGASLKPYEASIKCSILTTVATAVDPNVHLRLPASGNLVTNSGFTQVTNAIDSYISPGATQRSSILLRNKPVGWGAMSVDTGAWGEFATTDLFRTTNQSGMTVVTTGTFATNAGTAGIGYVNDPSPDALYLPFVWGSRYVSTRDLHDDVEDLCQPDLVPDIAPVVPLRTAQIAGRLNCAVTEILLPRPQATGDYVTFSFTHWTHLLYKIQNQAYDTRYMKAYAFLQFLDADGNPFQVWNASSQQMVNAAGDPLYHYDWLIRSGDTTDASNASTQKASSVIKPTHTYITWGPTKFTQSIPVPTATHKVRVGFIGGVRSSLRDDDVLSDVGESGGMFIDNISLILANSARP